MQEISVLGRSLHSVENLSNFELLYFCFAFVLKSPVFPDVLLKTIEIRADNKTCSEYCGNYSLTHRSKKIGKTHFQ